MKILAPHLTRTGTGRGALDGAPPPAAPRPPASAWAKLLRRVRLRRMRVASRAVRLARLAACAVGECPSAAELPGCARSLCLAKGCGCDDLHAVRRDAKCPRGRWGVVDRAQAP